MVFVVKCTATNEIYTYGHTLSLHDALPISRTRLRARVRGRAGPGSFRRATPVMGAAVMGTAETGGVQAHEIPLAAADGHRYTLLARVPERSEEHTSELQSLMRLSYADFCLKKNKFIIWLISHLTNCDLILYALSDSHRL